MAKKADKLEKGAVNTGAQNANVNVGSVAPVTNQTTTEKSPLALREEKVLEFWQKEEIFQKSLKKESPKGEFVFYDGPPFATGSPHYGHILASVIKDVIPRYKTMQGFHVARRWGWDCHGLPVENLVEKELGLASKKDIEQYGLQKFTDVAREFVLRYTDIWRNQVPRFGRFVDMDNDYRTMDPTYTESVWWVFKTLHSKGLITEGFKSMHLCPRCGTTLSNFEVNQGYKDVTDISVYVGFKVTSPKEIKSSYGNFAGKNIDLSNTSLVGWTTTPWTLPGNVALAVIPKGVYGKYRLVTKDESGKVNTDKPVYYIHLKDRIDSFKKVIKGELEEVEEMYGEDLIGISYAPAFPYYAQDKSIPKDQIKKAYKVYSADFVTTTDGTGIVHIAPAFGSDDYSLLKLYGLPFIQHVSPDGSFKAEVTDFAGMKVKPKDGTIKDATGKEIKDAHQLADIEIIKYLASAGTLVAKEKIVHSYPHCWRCETPLINYASSSWFVDVPSFADKLVAENKKVKWVPQEVGEFRFGNWLAGAREWAISRSRYWGAPIPVWKSDDGKEIKVIATREELSNALTPRNNFYVVRHGEATHNVSRVMSTNPQNKHALTERGKTQVRKTAEALMDKKIDVIYASPFYRTQETAKTIADALFVANGNTSNLEKDGTGNGKDSNGKSKKIEIVTDVRLSELNAGAFDGKPVAEYRASFGPHGDRFHMAPMGAETYTDVRKRVMDFIYEINSKNEGKNILIVTHDSPAWMLTAGSLGLTNSEAVTLRGTTEFFLDNAEVKNVRFVELPHNEKFEVDMHRPYIDQVILKDSRGQNMTRVKDVFDCWFESGSMPYGEAAYKGQALPHFNPKGSSNFVGGFAGNLMEKIFGQKIGDIFRSKNTGAGFPADFIAEGLDQTRGWFYSMMVLGVALFGKSPFKNVIVNGLVLAEDGKKMSKSLKNYPDPMLVVNKYGMDAVRFFLLSSSAVSAEDVCFTEKGVDEAMKKVINRLDNVVTFYETYSSAVIAGGAGNDVSAGANSSTHVLDVWVMNRLNETIEAVTKALEAYQLNVATRPIYDFIEDLSVWYLRRSRDRFKAEESKEEKEDRAQALNTTKTVLIELSKLIAPFMPFLAEDIFGRVTKIKDGSKQTELVSFGYKESVHLENWPTINIGSKNLSKAVINIDVLKNMADVRKVVTLGLEARTTSKIKVRQPLASITVGKEYKEVAEKAEYTALIKDELNVKEVKFDANATLPLTLDTVVTTALKEEGFVREVVHMIQDARKVAGLLVGERVRVTISTNEDGKRIISANQKNIEKLAQLDKISFVLITDANNQVVPNVDGIPVGIAL